MHEQSQHLMARPAAAPRLSPPGRRRAGGAWLVRVRLLPALIFVSVLMMGVRVGDVWQGLSGDQAPAAQWPLAAAAGTAHAAGSTDGDGDAAGEVEVATSDAGSAEAGVEAFDLEDLSAGEWDVLQQLSSRRDALDRRERELDQREALLAVAERRLEEKFAELAEVRGQIEALLRQVDEEGEAQLLGLVSIYEAMRPADAAAIFDGLDLEVLISVMERMRGQKSAAILAGMNPERARIVTTELARRRDLPELPD